MNSATRARQGSLRWLARLNFCLADVRDGLGPYLAIYLLAVRGPSHGWNEATVGAVITMAGIAGLVFQTPLGALVDRVTRRRMIIVVAASAVTISSLLLPFVSGYDAEMVRLGLTGLLKTFRAPQLHRFVAEDFPNPKVLDGSGGRNMIYLPLDRATGKDVPGVGAVMQSAANDALAGKEKQP